MSHFAVLFLESLQLALPFLDIGGRLLKSISESGVITFESLQFDFPFLGVGRTVG